jgi:hypothetical protein
LYRNAEDKVLDALTEEDRGNVGLPVNVLDPDKLDVRTNCIAAVSVDALLIGADRLNDSDAFNVPTPLNDDDPTKAYVPFSVLLELNAADRAKLGVAVSVDEPVRLAVPLLVSDGAASLAAIKATVI